MCIFHFINNIAANIFYLPNHPQCCPFTLPTFCAILSSSVFFHLHYSSDIIPYFFFLIWHGMFVGLDVSSALFHTSASTSSKFHFIFILCYDAYKVTDIECLLIYRISDVGILFKPYFSIIITFPLPVLCNDSFFRMWAFGDSLGWNIYSENMQDITSNIRTFENLEYYW